MTPQDEAHIKALEEEDRRLRTALSALLKEHDILSGNFGDVMDPKHERPDRWPTAASLARAEGRKQNTGSSGPDCAGGRQAAGGGGEIAEKASELAASSGPECAYCGETEGLRLYHDGGGYIEPNYICEECFSPSDDGPSFDDLPEAR